MSLKRKISRKNPSISESIKNTRKNPTKNRRKLVQRLESIKRNEYENWIGCDGNIKRYRTIFYKELDFRPINFLLDELKMKKPEIMILGPGKGYYAAEFKKDLRDNYGVEINIDALGFSKTIDSKLLDKNIRKDYSPNVSKATAFEHINPIEHPNLVKNIKGKYHLVIGERSVGLYSESKSYAIFQTSLLLAKRGRAYIDIQYTKENLRNILIIASRMINAYNKKNRTNIKLKITALKDTYVEPKDKSKKSIYIQIDRID